MRQRGFSLVELSIVLVILGLLVGGILAGQSLIKASELRDMIVQVDRVKTSAAAFRDKYFALPGDMGNATQFWGAQAGATTAGTDATCMALTTAATTAATCNGDGNGVVDLSHEQFRFWQHLANAGLIQGTTYAGVYNFSPYVGSYPGRNVYPMKRDNTGIAAYYMPKAPNLFYFYTSYGNGNQFMIGSTTYGGGPASWLDNAAMSADEAWNFDTKIDDGKPALGKVLGITNAYNATCVSPNPNNSDTYGAASNVPYVTYQVQNTALNTKARTGGCQLFVSMGL